MKAQVLQRCAPLFTRSAPLKFSELEIPVPGSGELLLRIHACGVCHTELDEIEGRTPPPVLPVIPGHQVVGEVYSLGARVCHFKIGDRVGVAWIYSSCGQCAYCQKDQENLCPEFRATGRDANGGYAEYMVVPEDFVYCIPNSLADIKAAPLLCAGAIGYRSLHLTGLENGQILGLTGFGGSGHLVLQMVQHRFPDSPVFVFARGRKQQEFAKQLGAAWVGKSDDIPPEQLDAIIDTTPAWKPVVDAMGVLAPGGRLVINAIRKENNDLEQLQRLDYAHHLWLEKEIKSVANVCRADVREFLDLAATIAIDPEVTTYPLLEANQALHDLKRGNIRGAKVLIIG